MKTLYQLIQENVRLGHWWISPNGKVESPANDMEYTHEHMTDRLFGKHLDSSQWPKTVFKKGWIRAGVYGTGMTLNFNKDMLNSKNKKGILTLWKKFKPTMVAVDVRNSGGHLDSSIMLKTFEDFWERYGND